VTEYEWLTCTDPVKMLEALRGQASNRKLRLFAVACCRRVGSRLCDEQLRTIVEVAEQEADGLAEPNRIRELRRGCHETRQLLGAALVARLGFTAATATEAQLRDLLGSDERADQAVAHACVLQEIFGNPLNPEPFVPLWCLNNHHAVRRLAESIYQNRQFRDLPILADALEDAGCDNRRILYHCRGGLRHFRGCWVLDGLLGRT
jgi:hypothetical protein